MNHYSFVSIYNVSLKANVRFHLITVRSGTYLKKSVPNFPRVHKLFTNKRGYLYYGVERFMCNTLHALLHKNIFLRYDIFFNTYVIIIIVSCYEMQLINLTSVGNAVLLVYFVYFFFF